MGKQANGLEEVRMSEGSEGQWKKCMAVYCLLKSDYVLAKEVLHTFRNESGLMPADV